MDPRTSLVPRMEHSGYRRGMRTGGSGYGAQGAIVADDFSEVSLMQNSIRVQARLLK